MDSKLTFISLAILLLTTVSLTSAAATLTDQCSDSFQKVTGCLTYASGKANTPGKDCCTSVQQIIGSQPVCLCYVIVEVHNGTESTKSLGLQESRLLQLPSACNLANGILSNCPKLLNISSTSPDYAIFTNATSTPSTVAGSSSSPAMKDKSIAFQTTPSLVGLVAIAMAISFFYSPFHYKFSP